MEIVLMQKNMIRDRENYEKCIKSLGSKDLNVQRYCRDMIKQGRDIPSGSILLKEDIPPCK